jgi:hypothetical protein
MMAENETAGEVVAIKRRHFPMNIHSADINLAEFP